MGISLAIESKKSTFDKVYVISVRSFTDRIAHVTNQLSKHKIEFEFIFDTDANTQSHNLIPPLKFREDELSFAHRDLILKHIQAWKNCIQNKYKSVLILEDDVILRDDFGIQIEKVYRKINFLTEGYLIFLSGRDTRVPKEFLMSNDILFKNKIPTADGYITDFNACQKRLNWLKDHLISKPADHLINQIDNDCNISQYWSRKYLVEQGSVYGLFSSTLDANRMKKPLFVNYLRYYLKILMRRTIPLMILKLTFYKIK